MKKILLSLVMGVLVLSACAPNDAHMSTAGTDIEAESFWARSAMKGNNSAAYLTLKNGTSQADELVGAASDAAETVEIHLSQMNSDGTMEMLPQASVPLPAGGALELKPGSYHIMLIGLKRDLSKGDEISLTLKFKNHPDLTLKVPVADAESMGDSGMDMP
jgi:periplasmic copper chaperone A